MMQMTRVTGTTHIMEGPPHLTPPTKVVMVRRMKDRGGGTSTSSRIGDGPYDPFRIEFIKCVREIHSKLVQILGAPLILKRPDSSEIEMVLAKKFGEILIAEP
ncbi:hypothetical protein HAX54_045710 [Datura stramonium]|uniref:Uncharacterized protein n=1 Tax=Datura stramonium TaxID=4076 RepID=A0ABS8WG23_DATST|nr:hypothetical protein [Datura stramonium]